MCGLVFVPRRPALHAFHKALKPAPFVKLSQGYALYGNNEVAIVHLTLGRAMLGTPANLDWTFTRTLEGWNVEKPWGKQKYIHCSGHVVNGFVQRTLAVLFTSGSTLR